MLNFEKMWNFYYISIASPVGIFLRKILTSPNGLKFHMHVSDDDSNGLKFHMHVSDDDSNKFCKFDEIW